MNNIIYKVAGILTGVLCLLSACNNQPSPQATTAEETAPQSFMDIVANRYSCRDFDSRQVSKEHLDVILEAGRLAPTAKNLQEHHVYVCQSPEVLAKLDALTPCRYGAPTCLVVTWDATNVFTYPGGKHDSGAEDATIVATHLMLAAKSIGVESCWLNYFNPDEVRTALNIPKNENVLMILPIGYAGKNAAPNQNHFSRKPLEETVTYL